MWRLSVGGGAGGRKNVWGGVIGEKEK